MNWLNPPANSVHLLAEQIKRLELRLSYEGQRNRNEALRPEAIRLQCLDLAVRADKGDAVAEAQRMYEFVTATSVPKTPRQVIDATLEAAGVR